VNSTNKSRRTPAETQAIVAQGLRRRYWAERRFRAYGLAAVSAGMAFLVYLFFVIFSNGIGAFRQAQLQIPVYYDPQLIDPSGNRNPDELAAADYAAVIRASLKAKFPDAEGRAGSRELMRLVSGSAPFDLQKRVLADPSLIGKTEPRWLLASDAVDLLLKEQVDRTLPEAERPLSDRQLAWSDKLKAEGALELKFNKIFVTGGDSREPENAGIWGAVVGSFFMLALTLLLSFPIGVATAIYL
jgi:phosphate transport system permease protein